MKQWDIYLYPFPSESEPHFFVVISPTEICQNLNKRFVNGLVCQTVRPPTRPQQKNEVYLDRVDGMEWKTLVRCEFIHVLDRSQIIGARRGSVSGARIEEIRHKLRTFF
jgi:hypothetical protein